MKTRLWIITLLSLSLHLRLAAAEPAEFTVMLLGYCLAGSTQTDPDAPGGFGTSDNLPKPLSAAPAQQNLYLEIIDTGDAVFAEKYNGLRLRLVNGTQKTAELSAADSRLSIVQEALDADGTWKDIEYLPRSWCGNSFHKVYLPVKHYWEFVAPKYSGPQKTKLRFRLSISNHHTIYSPVYDGGIHPGQFTQRADRPATSLMDPDGK